MTSKFSAAKLKSPPEYEWHACGYKAVKEGDGIRLVWYDTFNGVGPEDAEGAD